MFLSLARPVLGQLKYRRRPSNLCQPTLWRPIRTAKSYHSHQHRSAFRTEAPWFLQQSEGNVPLYGSLSVRDAIFYVKATFTQLKTIVASAPRHLRNHLPASPTSMLLETVLALRTEEAVNIRMNQRSPGESLQELMNLQPDQLKALAVADQPHLAELMTAALQADRRMQPREVHDSADQMIITVLSWNRCS